MSTHNHSDVMESYNKNGTIFYVTQGDRLEHYQTSKCRVSDFIYTETQRTLITCECDWSFTKSIIHKRGSGSNLCSTMWYYESQYQAIESTIGWSTVSNLEFCESSKCKITFGIDARNLRKSEKQWNDKSGTKFDRILCTFPRMHHIDWSKSEYNTQNAELMSKLLLSFKSHLSDDGQIHILLFEDQFYHWKLNQCLEQLGMQLVRWSKLNSLALHEHFAFYTPRDKFGNPMHMKDTNGEDLVMNLCCFGIQSDTDQSDISLLHSVNNTIHQIPATCTIDTKPRPRTRHLLPPRLLKKKQRQRLLKKKKQLMKQLNHIHRSLEKHDERDQQLSIAIYLDVMDDTFRTLALERKIHNCEAEIDLHRKQELCFMFLLDMVDAYECKEVETEWSDRQKIEREYIQHLAEHLNKLWEVIIIITERVEQLQQHMESLKTTNQQINKCYSSSCGIDEQLELYKLYIANDTKTQQNILCSMCEDVSKAKQIVSPTVFEAFYDALQKQMNIKK
eukprot:37654_1